MLERPSLKKQDLPYRGAFFILNSSRFRIMGEYQPVPISEMLALAKEGGIASFADKSKYIHLMQKLDRTFLNFNAEKQASKSA